MGEARWSDGWDGGSDWTDPARGIGVRVIRYSGDPDPPLTKAAQGRHWVVSIARGPEGIVKLPERFADLESAKAAAEEWVAAHPRYLASRRPGRKRWCRVPNRPD